MKAMVLTEYGKNAQFKQQEVDKPEVKPFEVLVKIEASSVNPVDTMIRQLGRDFPISPELPAILGMDFAGTVQKVGSGVQGFSEGDEVYGCAGGLADLQGTLADYIAADVKLMAKKPKTLNMKEAAALPLVGITAYEGLTRAHVQNGQKVLVHGGAGGVGHVAVQMAKAFGAEVFATGSNDEKLSIIKNYGGTPINYKRSSVKEYAEKFTDGNGFDVIYDSVGGENLPKSFEACKLNGEIATTTSKNKIDLSPLHMKGLSLHVVLMLIPMLYDLKREGHGKILKEMAQMVDSGNLKPLLDKKSFSLGEVNEAYAHLESGKAVGKVIIEN